MEVKPNSSELSYLLYYASTRRSKLQKVGDFLDKRTINDVWRGRIGYVNWFRGLWEEVEGSHQHYSNVQVTLQIIKALIEKSPRDLPLYVAAILRIFKTILKSQDITMIEETIPTFETLCAHQDPANLAADQDYIRQYEEIISTYALFASKDAPIQTKPAKSVPVQLRFRKAGLEAIKAIARSDSLSAETGRQLAIIVHPILENIYAESGQYLTLLEATEEQKAEYEKQLAIRRRQSTSTVRTFEEDEGDPEAAHGTTEAADKIAEREAAVTALQALKTIFAIVPRAQLRLATSEVLKFMALRIRPQEHFGASITISLQTGSWPCMLFGMICFWAPVQDRYVILVTAMETLVRSPIIEEDLEKQYVFATIIGWLLSSDINFIGLSVMDVLVGLIQHILLLLQLGGRGTDIRPHGQQADVINAADASAVPRTVADEKEKDVIMEVVSTPSPERRQLLAQLQRCIGSLAVHVYYTEQINDMITAILARLIPSPLSSISTTASAIENPAAAVEAIASSVSLSEKPNTDGFFSFDTARVAALGAIKEIIAWANLTKLDGSSNAATRSPIGLSVWEGTQWLLRDPNWAGRAAYVEALLVWMKYELKRKDLRVEEEKKQLKSERKENGNKGESLARRVVSNASHRDKSPMRKKDTFLQLLHLAIYENAHQYAESACDILLLHLLLSHSVQKLGVNALQYGLPMIMRLQDDIASMESPRARINVGSLVHGYIWAVSAYFDFDASTTGREIQNEIAERIKNGVWLNGVKVPPMPFDQIMQRSQQQQLGLQEAAPPEEVNFKIYENRSILIGKVSEGYSMVVYSPPASPPQSPGRTYSVPVLSTHISTGSIPKAPQPSQLPQKIKDALVVEWSREACIEATSRTQGSRTGSLTGSGQQTGSGSRHLAVNGPGQAVQNGSNVTMNGDTQHSPHRSHHHAQIRARSPYGLVQKGASKRNKRASRTPTPLTSSSVRSAVRIDDLKRVLSGSGPAFPLVSSSSALGIRGGEGDEEGEGTESESMVSYEGSEMSAAAANAGPVGGEPRPSDGAGEARRPAEQQGVDGRDGITEGSVTPRPMTSSFARQHHSPLLAKASVDEFVDAQETQTQNDTVPPVPPLPASLLASSPPRTAPSLESAKLPPASPPRAVSIVASERSRPRTANSSKRNVSGPPTAGTGKTWSLKEHRTSSPFGAKDVWGFSARDLLRDIDADLPSPGGYSSGSGYGVGGGGFAKPPY